MIVPIVVGHGFMKCAAKRKILAGPSVNLGGPIARYPNEVTRIDRPDSVIETLRGDETDFTSRMCADRDDTSSAIA